MRVGFMGTPGFAGSLYVRTVPGFAWPSWYIVLPTNAPNIIPAAARDMAIKVFRKNFSISGEFTAASPATNPKPI